MKRKMGATIPCWMITSSATEGFLTRTLMAAILRISGRNGVLSWVPLPLEIPPGVRRRSLWIIESSFLHVLTFLKRES